MLKPSELGVTGRKRTISEHQTLVLKKLNALTNKKVAAICKDILMSENGDNINIPKGVNPQQINEIVNYFAEVAGPILVVTNNLIPGITSSNV